MESTQTEVLSSLAASSFPLLVYDHGEEPDNSQMVFSVADGSTRTLKIPELRNYRCLETPSGLVLIVDTASLQSSLWDPQTGEKMALPVMDKALPDRCRCLLSDTFTAPDCLVLIYDLRQPELLSVRVLSLYHDPEPRLEIANFDAPMPTIVTDALQIITMSYLLESSQELFMVCLFYVHYSFERPEEVGAYRMDFDKHQWCKVTDIGDRAFILGPANFAASCSAKEHGLKSGCVYFAYDFMGDSNNFHIFDLMEGTREVVGPTQHVPVLSRKPFWLLPVLP
ncbi:hypothetical protein QOZ80_1BG0059640 [Eleusine coracana subsp. coracana]|nr:hypothetical protein QOZ80_1BG0059640 [Eleusine coracana subsp. coracana]